MDCLQQLLKKYLNDDIVDKMKLHHTKATYLIKNAISPAYQEQTLMLLRDCDAFVIAFDECEVNKRSELEVMVKLSHKEHGLQLRHYQSIELENGLVKTIVEANLDSLTEDAVDYRSKLIGASTDGCNTMEGRLKGVKKLLADAVPGFKDVGSCNDHHIDNAFEYGVKQFDNDCHKALVNIFFDLGGAKGKGLKKKKPFEAVCHKLGVQPVPFKKLCTTRFRFYVIAVKLVLANWYVIVECYKSVKQPTERQQKLKSFFADREVMTKLKLNFIWSSSEHLIDALDFFEQRIEEVHNLHTKMTDVLVCNLKKHLQPQVVEQMDEEGNLKLKSSRDILNVDLKSEDNKLNPKKVFIGTKCEKMIKGLGLTPTSSQLQWFFKKVFEHHQTMSFYLIKYFQKGLLSAELKYFTALSKNPIKVSHITHVKIFIKDFF